jgi:hypothetical protein
MNERAPHVSRMRALAPFGTRCAHCLGPVEIVGQEVITEFEALGGSGMFVGRTTIRTWGEPCGHRFLIPPGPRSPVWN